MLGFNGWAITTLQLPLWSRWLSPDNARNLAVVLSLGLLVLPPLWLSRKMKRKRVWFRRYLLFFNALLAGGLIYYASHTPPPATPSTPIASPTAKPRPKHTPLPLVTPTPIASATPTLIASATPTPEITGTPTPEASETPRESPQFVDPAEAGKRYTAIDQHALEAPAAVEKDVDTLARYLVGPARNDEEKIRAIYRWVTDRISYDAKAFYANDLPDPSSEVTLRRRTAVCGGYAVLVYELGKAAGLKIEEVDGYASAASADPDEKENHAWNAVKLPGGWRLLDATWGAGALGDDHKFHKEFNEFFFLTPADRMLVTHFPTDKNWQLTLPPISREEFMRRPKRRPEYFQLGLKVNQLVGELAADPRVSLDFQAPQGLYLSAQLLSEDEKEVEHSTMVDRDEGRIVVNVLPPGPGKYSLRIFAFRPGSNYGQGVLEYTILAKSGQPDGYPQIFSDFQQHSGHVFRPAGGRLKPGLQHFELELSGAKQVFVDDWDNELQKDGDRFVGDVILEPGEAKIFAVFSGRRGEEIISYQVR